MGEQAWQNLSQLNPRKNYRVNPLEKLFKMPSNSSRQVDGSVGSQH